MSGVPAGESRSPRSPRNGRLVVAVKLHAGLGNRMRAVLSGEVLADETGRRFAYCWPVGGPFGARLTELWDYDRETVSAPLFRAAELAGLVRDASPEWRADAAASRRWLIRTGQPIASQSGRLLWPERLRSLRPTAALSDRIRAFHDTHFAGRRYVGLMVRAHQVSHAKSQQHSPVEWFVRRMQELRRDDPDLAFFLSCDVPEVQRDLIRRFPDTFGLDDKGGYNSAQAIRSAVVDTYLLAASAHLIGPHFSSFPELAYHLAGGRIRLETSMTGPDDAWRRDSITVAADPLVPARG